MVNFRRATIGVLLAIATLCPYGCRRGPVSGPTEIVYWTGWTGHEYDTLQLLVDEFNRAHPDVHVRMLSQGSGTGLYEKVRIAFAGGATPDVMSTIWDRELSGYAMRGVLDPLDRYLAGSGRNLEREYTPGVAHMLRIDGHVYGLTITTNTNLIVYNKQLFRESGLDPERPPRTTADLDRCAKATTLENADGALVRYGFRPTDLSLWSYVFGGRWYDPETRDVTANDPHNVAALRWMASYGRMFDLKKLTAFSATFGDTESASGPFFTGKMVMWSTGEWSEEFIRRYAPSLQWGWFALPCPPEGRPNTTKAGGSIFVIPAACRHKAAAWEFLNWLTSPHAVTAFCAAIKNVPPLIESGNDPRFRKDAFFRFAIGIAQGKNSFGAPPIPIWPAYQREIERAEEAAVLGGANPQRTLDEVQVRMHLELKRTLAELQP